MHTRWVGEHLRNLLTKSVSELCVLYPDYKKGSLAGKKAYWDKKLREGKIQMPGPSPEYQKAAEGFGIDVPADAHVSWHVGYIKNADGEIEYTKPLPSVHPGQLEKPVPEFEPATPAKITFTRRKPKEMDYRTLFVFSDAQIDFRRLEDGTLAPIHDTRAMEAARLLCRDLSPSEIINLGDTVDLSALSKFKLDSDHFQRTLGPSFQAAHDYYAALRSDSPNAKVTEVDSNHNTRLKDFMLKNAPQMYGIKRAGADEEEYPVLTYPYLANLRHLGVEWISGYGAAEYVYGVEYELPPIVFKHGQTMVSAGSTANKESKDNPENHVVRGHGHRMEMHTRTNRAGQYLSSIMLGTLCRTTGEVPSYHSAVDDRGRVVKNQENWQQSCLVIEDYHGVYHFNSVPINDGVIHFRGKEYRASDANM